MKIIPINGVECIVLPDGRAARVHTFYSPENVKEAEQLLLKSVMCEVQLQYQKLTAADMRQPAIAQVGAMMLEAAIKIPEDCVQAAIKILTGEWQPGLMVSHEEDDRLIVAATFLVHEAERIQNAQDTP